MVASQNHRMVSVGRDLKFHLVPAPPWAPSAIPGCSKPLPTWPWTFPGMGIELQDAELHQPSEGKKGGCVLESKP